MSYKTVRCPVLRTKTHYSYAVLRASSVDCQQTNMASVALSCPGSRRLSQAGHRLSGLVMMSLVCHFERSLWRSSGQCAGSSATFTVHGWRTQYYSETWTGWSFLRWRLFSLSPSGPALCCVQLPTVTACVDDISCWMFSNRLKINMDKTQFIWLGSPQQQLLAKLNVRTITLADVDIEVSEIPVSGLCSIALWHLWLT